MFFQSKHIIRGLGSRFYDQTMKAWKDRRGKGKGTKTKKNADRFRETNKTGFLSCSNYNKLSSLFLDFVCWFLE